MLFLITTAFAVHFSAPVSAQEFPEPQDRNYALDLYSGNAIGSNEIVSMGGVAVAVARGSAGMTVNPAAAAIRSQTSRGSWDWDFHFDALGSVAGNDFDNNGVEDEGASDFRPLLTFGIVGNIKRYAIGFTLSSVTVSSLAPTGNRIFVSNRAAQAHFAMSFRNEQLYVGGGFTGNDLDVESGDADLFKLTSSVLEAGTVFAPTDTSVRLGAAVKFPATGDEVTVEACDPMDCEGLILPQRIEVPWSLTVGAGWRRAPTPWNRRVNKRFIDERDLTLGADIRVTGAVKNGNGIGQFSKGRLQPSGDRIAISGRAGLEYTLVPSRLRIRAGSYWEPSRFLDESGDPVAGRLHLTAGADLRIFRFHFFKSYRIRISFTFDGAENYVNSGFSIGFWN